MPMNWLKSMIREVLREELLLLRTELIALEGNNYRIMSAVDDKITAVQTALNKFAADFKTEVDGLKAEIAAGGDTTARLTALDGLVTQIQGLDASAVADTPAPAPAAAEPATATTEPAPTA